MQIWSCKIGEVDEEVPPKGADYPLRQAVKKAYKKLTGEDPKFCFSGWGAKLDEIEREVADGK